MAEARYHPGLFWLSFLTSAIAFVLIGSGGMVTSTGVGMVDHTWTFSPFKLLTIRGLEESLMSAGMFIEHSHRQVGYIVGMLALVLAIWCFYWESGTRRYLGLAVLVAVGLQGALGAARILLNPERGYVNLNLGRDYAMVHGFFGQMTFAFLAGCTLAFSRAWIDHSRQGSSQYQSIFRISRALLVLFVVQLGIAVFVRHVGGDHILITHASVAGLIVLLSLALFARSQMIPDRFVRWPAALLAVVVLGMILLGTSAWWLGAGYGAMDTTPASLHRIVLATLHQWLGALALALSLIVTLRIHRHLFAIESGPVPQGAQS